MATEIDDLPGEQVPNATPAPAAPAPAASSPAPDDHPDPADYELDDAQFEAAVAAHLKPAPKAEAPKPEPAPEPQPAPAARPAHNPHLVAMAKDFGFSDAEISFHTPDELTIAVRHLSRQQLRQQQLAAMPPAKPAPPPEPAFDPDLGESAKNYEPELIGLLKKASDAARREALKDIKALEDKINAERAAEKAQLAAEKSWVAADAHFAKNERLYGKGDYTTVDDKSPAFLRRSQVYELARKHGVSFAQAEAALFGDLLGAAPAAPPAPAARPRPAATPAPAPEPTPAAGPSPLDVWNNAALSVPTNRLSEAPKGRAKAIATVAQFMKETANGTGGSIHGEGDEEDSLAD